MLFCFRTLSRWGGELFDRRLTQMNADLRDPETYAIIGAAMEVHRELGRGFLEAVYGDALSVELASRKIPFEREKELPVKYKGRILPTLYKADFVCFGAVLVECKAIAEMGKREEAQVLNYLRITGLPRGILLNFATQSLAYKRLVLSSEKICENLRQSADKITL
jgi:GxxExxY protein